MAMPQRDEMIEGIKRLDALLEYAVMHGDEATRCAAALLCKCIQSFVSIVPETIDGSVLV